jgi:hypothetical protein
VDAENLCYLAGYSGSLLDDHPEDAGQIEAQIVTADRELLARPGPRIWIKLMAVLGRSPLTQTTRHYNADVDPQALQLSDCLCADLARWDRYFATVLSGWPQAGGFESQHDAERFVAESRQLVMRLQEELGPAYNVEYMPEPGRLPGVKVAAPRSQQATTG